MADEYKGAIVSVLKDGSLLLVDMSFLLPLTD